MPFFGNKKEKLNGTPNYPKQQAPPPPQVGHHPPTYPQGDFVNQGDQFFYAPAGPQLQSSPGGVTLAFARNDLPGADRNWGEGFLDGPDFSNRVPDRNIPPAPGSYYFYSHNNAGPSSSSVASPPLASAPTNSYPPPPTYEEVLSQEVKKKL